MKQQQEQQQLQQELQEQRASLATRVAELGQKEEVGGSAHCSHSLYLSTPNSLFFSTRASSLDGATSTMWKATSHGPLHPLPLHSTGTGGTGGRIVGSPG